MFLVDTNVISEARKGEKADSGVRGFFAGVRKRREDVFVSAITMGELRRGIELIRHRGDDAQAVQLERWLVRMVRDYEDFILPFDDDAAQIWGRLRVPHPENALDKQIAATALLHDLVLVTRNSRDFAATGVKLLNPFS